MTENMEESNNTSITGQSHPIEIPTSKHENFSFDLNHHGANKQSGSSQSHHHDKTESFKSDEEYRLPDGSPYFSEIMQELSSSLSKTTIRPEIEFPLSFHDPVDDHLTDVFSSDENLSTDLKTAPERESPQTVKKGLTVVHQSQRNRSQSWNYRNKMAAEKRKQLSSTVPRHLETNSAHSSPINIRKKKHVKIPSGSPHLLQVHPKFKILSQNLSVSHEDLVKEQECEQHLAEDFSQVKSIFQAPNFDRSGATPE